jgi:hypothetical protein
MDIKASSETKSHRHPATRSIGLRLSVLSAEIENVSEVRPKITVFIANRVQSSTELYTVYTLLIPDSAELRRRPVQHPAGSPTPELH